MRPVGVPDGPAALGELYRAVAEGDPYRLVLIDMRMPGMDGAAFACTLRADHRLDETIMVLMGGTDFRNAAQQAVDLGAIGCLAKPIRKRDLRAALSSAVDGRLPAAVAPRSARSYGTAWTAQAPVDVRRALRVLVVDDNVTNQQVAHGILGKLGLRADAVANGQEAVAALANDAYDLVLMDVQMPVMDGYEATQLIRDHRSAVRDHQIPIIAMTSHALQGDDNKCLAAGMNGYVPKPVNPHVLVEELRKWLPSHDPIISGTADRSPTPENSGAVPVPDWDRSVLMVRLECDEDLIRTIINGFLDDMPNQIRILDGMLERNDVRAVAYQAHAIRGASANVGGESLRIVALKMEEAAALGDLELAREQMDDLRKAFDRTRRAALRLPVAPH